MLASLDSSFTAFMSAPSASSIHNTSSFPCMLAQCAGAHPYMSGLSRLAPYSARIGRISWWPYSLAACAGQDRSSSSSSLGSAPIARTYGATVSKDLSFPKKSLGLVLGRTGTRYRVSFFFFKKI
jgi:hypothetical protein